LITSEISKLIVNDEEKLLLLKGTQIILKKIRIYEKENIFIDSFPNFEKLNKQNNNG